MEYPRVHTPVTYVWMNTVLRKQKNRSFAASVAIKIKCGFRISFMKMIARMVHILPTMDMVHSILPSIAPQIFPAFVSNGAGLLPVLLL
jgi:hypothetical protein